MRQPITLGMTLSCLLTLAAAEPQPLLVTPGSDLYPEDAKAQALEGDVPVTLSVGETGEFRCSVGANPQLGSLRRASCELIARRNVFGPRTVDGKATATTYNFLVQWRLKADNRQFGGAVPIGRARWITYADYPPIARHDMMTGRVGVAFEISQYGLIENCSIAKSSTPNALAGEMCPLLQKRALFLPALDQEGHPQRTSGSFNTNWKWCDMSRQESCHPDTGE